MFTFMKLFRFQLQTLTILFIFLISQISYHPISATRFKTPRLGLFARTTQRQHQTQTQTQTQTTVSSSTASSKHFKTFYYAQRLDHFNYKPESYTTFKQKYVINFKHWGGANNNAPIFAYLGAEEALVNDIGFLGNYAPRFKALLVYMEHRYYGDSMPFGSTEKTLNGSSRLGYFNSAQAIADYAVILLHVKKKLSAHNSPIIVFGGSYGGMLAAWFRLKYPHIALGALASSAPLLYFDGIAPKVGYYSVVSRDFKEESENCYDKISKSWTEIDKIASKPNGLSILKKKFNICKPLKSSFELKDFLDSLYCEAAQYNAPPFYHVSSICDAIDKSKGKDLLNQIFEGVVGYLGNQSCYNVNEFYDLNDPALFGWKWQTCTEMVMPVGHDGNDSMFQPAPFNLEEYANDCKRIYGVTPQPHWITTYYGGHDIKLILHRFGSNIIFSNGLRDPYSVGGVLKNISDSIVAVYTEKGSHCLDIQRAQKTDPKWLIMQRKTEVDIIHGWINKYYIDLTHLRDV